MGRTAEVGFRTGQTGRSPRTKPFDSTPTAHGGDPHSIGHIPSVVCAPISRSIIVAIWAFAIKPNGQMHTAATMATTTAVTKSTAFGLLNCRIRLSLYTQSVTVSILILLTSQHVNTTYATLILG